jgi:outer membrane lipoprotein SlyB
MRAICLTLFASAAVFAGGCANEPSGRSYSSAQTRTTFDIEYGEVVEIRVVKIEGEAGFLGAWGGASVGHAIGASTSGSHSTRRIAAAVGGVAGAVAGQAVERKIREDEAYEITVRLDNADVIAVVQALDVEFSPGDRVRVLLGRDGSARVSAI